MCCDRTASLHLNLPNCLIAVMYRYMEDNAK